MGKLESDTGPLGSAGLTVAHSHDNESKVCRSRVNGIRNFWIEISHSNSYYLCFVNNFRTIWKRDGFAI